VRSGTILNTFEVVRRKTGTTTQLSPPPPAAAVQWAQAPVSNLGSSAFFRPVIPIYLCRPACLFVWVVVVGLSFPSPFFFNPSEPLRIAMLTHNHIFRPQAGLLPIFFFVGFFSFACTVGDILKCMTQLYIRLDYAKSPDQNCFIFCARESAALGYDVFQTHWSMPR
jgi:hypothetical protein